MGVLGGGLLTDGPGWQWIFLVNIPIGLLLMGLAFQYLPKDMIEKGLHRFNATAAITITAGLMAFVYGLTHGAESGWGSPLTLGSFGMAALLLTAFALIEMRSRVPLIHFDILKNRPSAAVIIAGFFGFGALFAFIFATSLFLQHQLQYSPTQAGVTWLITTITSFVSAMWVGSKLVGKFSIKSLLISGLSLLFLAALLMARMPSDPTFAVDIFPPLLFAGLGGGMIGPIVQIGALTGVHPKRFGLVSGIVETMREIGSVLVIAGVSTALAIGVTAPNGFRAAYSVIGTAAAAGLIVIMVALRKPRAIPFSREVPVNEQ